MGTVARTLAEVRDLLEGVMESIKDLQKTGAMAITEVGEDVFKDVVVANTKITQLLHMAQAMEAESYGAEVNPELTEEGFDEDEIGLGDLEEILNVHPLDPDSFFDRWADQ